MTSKDRKYPPLSLGIIAALTPDNWDIEIIDENFDTFSYKHADLIGITAYTSNVARAYEIASLYKQNNVHTVIGGIHATVLPEEAEKYVDTVVIGEAEKTWPQLIADFEKKEIKRHYKCTELHDLKNLPQPRRDLFDKRYTQSLIQTSRGCPSHCDFCLAPIIGGKKTRYRPVEEVLDELESIREQTIFFTDDNFIGTGKTNISRSIELFEGIIKRNIKKEWFSYAGVNCADNEKVLELAAKSGCKVLFIGIETEDKATLESSGKNFNLRQVDDHYKKMLQIIHKYGIIVMAGIMYGFDTDSKQNLLNRNSFVSKSSIDMFHITTVTPFPGTGLYNRLKSENRLLYPPSPEHWSKYNNKEMVFEPKLVSKEYFDLFIYKTHKKLYGKNFLKFRYLKTLVLTKNKKTAIAAYHGNLDTAYSFK